MTAWTSRGAPSRSLGDRVVLIAIIVLGLVMLAPIFWAAGLSLKSNAALLVDTQSVLHPPYTLGNYTDILVGSQVFRWVMNSAIVSLGVTFGVLALSSLAG